MVYTLTKGVSGVLPLRHYGLRSGLRNYLRPDKHTVPSINLPELPPVAEYMPAAVVPVVFTAAMILAVSMWLHPVPGSQAGPATHQPSGYASGQSNRIRTSSGHNPAATPGRRQATAAYKPAAASPATYQQANTQQVGGMGSGTNLISGTTTTTAPVTSTTTPTSPAPSPTSSSDGTSVSAGVNIGSTSIQANATTSPLSASLQVQN